MVKRYAVFAVVAAAVASCTVAVDPEVGAGLGTSCQRDDQCQGSSCIDGICAVHCGDTSGCPGGTVCATGACQLPLEVAFIFPFDLDQDELGRSLDEGRADAEESLGYVDSISTVGLALASEATDEASALTAAGREVIVSTTPTHADAFAGFAAAHPDTWVLSYQGTATGPNLVPFDARTYQAYYLAGIAAARFTTTRRIGFIGSIPSPPIVASVNAFALGAQSQGGPPITVELRWIGAPHDTQPVDGITRERRFTEEMVTAGADVIAHTVDNSIPLFTVADLVEEGANVYAIGANVEDACEAAPETRCIGSTFFHWGPLLAQVLDDIHRQRLETPSILASIQTSNDDSPIGFVVGSVPGGVALASDLEETRATLASEQGVGSIFDGPITSTGQCEEVLGTTPCVPVGMRLSDQGLASMCWLVAGIVDETGAPARVPEECSQ